MLGLRAAANLETGLSNIDNASSFGRELSSAMANQRFVENPWHDKNKSRARVPYDLWKRSVF